MVTVCVSQLIPNGNVFSCCLNCPWLISCRKQGSRLFSTCGLAAVKLLLPKVLCDTYHVRNKFDIISSEWENDTK